MGFAIVMIVGAVLGWLAAILIDRDDRVGTALCSTVGLIGAVGGALAIGDVPLAAGISEAQLLWSAMGALFAIVATNAVLMHRVPPKLGNV